MDFSTHQSHLLRRYWRVSTRVLGLSKRLTVEFKKDKKKRKKYIPAPLERYFHLDLTEEEEPVTLALFLSIEFYKVMQLIQFCILLNHVYE